MKAENILSLGIFHRNTVRNAGRPGTVISNILNLFNIVSLENDTSVTPGFVNEGCWEPEITAWLWNNPPKNKLFIDVGANAGYFSLLAEKLGASVIAYEPNPVYADLLEVNRKINNANFEISPVALSDRHGVMQLIVPDGRHGDATIVQNWREGDWQEVEVTKLDYDYDHAQDDRPYILKIDVEAAEEQVWDGAQDLLNSGRDGTVLIEWTPGMYSPDFFDKLKAWGRVTYITADGTEAPVERDWLDAQPVWKMVVVRKR